METSDLVLESTATISGHCQLDSQMFSVKQQLSYIAQSVRMCTGQESDTKTKTALSLEQDSHICSLWYVQSTDLEDLPANSFPSFVDSRYITQPTKYSKKQQKVFKMLLRAIPDIVDNRQ